MRKLLFKVEDRICDDCALALRRFIGHMPGIESIGVENMQIDVVFDPGKKTDKDLVRIMTNSMEILGHKPTGHWHFI